MSPPSADDPDPDRGLCIQAIKQVLADAGFYRGTIDTAPNRAAIEAVVGLRDAYASLDAALSELLEQRKALQADREAVQRELEATRTALSACRESSAPDFDRTDAVVGKIIRDAFRAIAASERKPQ